MRRDLSKPVGFVGDSGRGGAGSAISDSRIGGGRNGKSKQGASKPKVLRSGADDETDVSSSVPLNSLIFCSRTRYRASSRVQKDWFSEASMAELFGSLKSCV